MKKNNVFSCRNKILGLVVIPCILATCMPYLKIQVQASRGVIQYLPLVIEQGTGSYLNSDSGEKKQVGAIDLSYENNTYVSLGDIENYLADTDAAFTLKVTKDEISITSQKPDISEDEDESDSSDEESDTDGNVTCYLKANSIKVDDNKRLYYSILVDYDDDGDTDCFMTPYDIAMILDVYIELKENDCLYIDPSRNYNVDPAALEADGYFQGVNALVCGNASTGELFYNYNSDVEFPIASTTKLMTYLLTKEYLTRTGGTESDMVTISENVEFLSTGDDGVVPMKAGMQVSVHELMEAMLIPSSNAAALALSEYVAGSEEEFVVLMNEQAQKLEMTTASYYNCNGLPIFTDSTYAAKKQNRMSATDMFKLCSYILALYPEITDITSIQKTTLENLNKEIDNTNAVIYNIPEATGLKTGTTTKAGACLVTSVHMGEVTEGEDLLVVLLGAETGSERARISETMARYSMAVWKGEAKAYGQDTDLVNSETPTTAEGFVSIVTREARRKFMSALQDNN